MATSPLEIPPPSDFPSAPEDLEHPPQPLPLYDLTRLDDPPDDWEFFNIKYLTVKKGNNRSFKLPQVKVLIKHYFWGIHYTDPVETTMTKRKSPSLKVLQSLLFKLIYYTQEVHRPKTWAQLLDVNRDTGPRLLKYELDPRPKPLSRWYTSPPDVGTRILDAYIRPLNAPPDLPDYVLQQYLYSADSLFTPPPTPLLPPPSAEAEREEFLRVSLLEHLNPGVAVSPKYARPVSPVPTPVPAPVSSSVPAPARTIEFRYKRAPEEIIHPPSKRQRHISPGAPAYRPQPHPTPPYQEPVFAADEITTFTWTPGLAPSATVAPTEKLELGPLVQNAAPQFDTRAITEAVERALMQFVYEDLERDPSVPPTDKPARHLTARSFNDVLKMKLGSFLCTANVKLSPLTFEWDPNGTVFPLRGRGPIWGSMSCAYDAVIVAGKLLDAGCTRIDRAHNRAAEFKDIEKAFIEMTNASWETFDEQTSTHVRDEFIRFFVDGQSQMTMGKPIPPWAVWSVATKSFAQFRYHHVERVTPCRCHIGLPFFNAHQGSCILPGFQPGDENGVDLRELVERCFYRQKHFKCRKCQDPMGIIGERKIGQLPLRLVMTFDVKTRLRNSTENLTFNYVDYEDKPQVAHYRWLGGVYNNDSHARLFWTDSARGEKDDGDIMMYDSQVNSGVIVGGISAFQLEEKVPTEWVNHNSIPLLFFERIMNPTSGLLATAHSAVYDMEHCLTKDRNILFEHAPWTRLASPARDEPWPRVLSHNGERFSEFNPDWAVLEPSPTFAPASDVSMSNIDPALLDPSIVDTSLVDPALYSVSTPPLFDISEFIEPTAIDTLTNYQPQAEDMQTVNMNQSHMFGSMMVTPDWLNRQTELWPSGVPSAEGALEFPDLPSLPSSPNGRRGTGTSDTTMADAVAPPYHASIGRRRSIHIAHTDGLKKAAITNYALAKQALSPRQKQILDAQKKHGYNSKKTFSDKDSDEQKKQEERDRKRREKQKMQEEHERKKREEEKKQQQKKQEDEARKRKEEDEREEENARKREEEKNKKKPKPKQKKNQKQEVEKASNGFSRRAGLRNSRKKNPDPTWKPTSDPDLSS
ncbi:hypothetical protein N7475_002577 [Penicillium sp. IBT 31633x]|nr:hypothetical protein N7475_002577 [Penicillium sp. IBT 31633x]